MKERKRKKVNHGFFYKKRNHIKATQSKTVMNKRPGRRAALSFNEAKK